MQSPGLLAGSAAALAVGAALTLSGTPALANGGDFFQEFADQMAERNPEIGPSYFGFVRDARGRLQRRTREEVLARFRRYLLANTPLMATLREQARQELRGKDLVCWCAPLACHASIWMEIAASASDQELTLE